jgi:hypothetical protein
MPDPTATVTDGTTGIAFAANVPIGPTTIGGTTISPTDTSRTLNMRSRTIFLPTSDGVIQAELQP